MRLCKDCEHFQPNDGGYFGARCERLTYVSLVTGQIIHEFCADARATLGGDCGPDGKLFIPRLVEIADATIGATALAG